MCDTEYYDILGLKKPSNKKEIKKAYKKLALKWHPDKSNYNEEISANIFKKINEAYSVLNDDNKKEMYDRYGKNREKPDETFNESNGFTEIPGGFMYVSPGFSEFDIFKEVFGEDPFAEEIINANIQEGDLLKADYKKGNDALSITVVKEGFLSLPAVATAALNEDGNEEKKESSSDAEATD